MEATNKLCWKSDGITKCVKFKTISEIEKVMSAHLYNWEWIEDAKGQKLDIDVRNMCARSSV